MTVATKSMVDLSSFNIETDQIIHNLSYDELYNHELSETTVGYEKGIETKSGAVTVDTGKFTGRSAQDKYIVTTKSAEENVWWCENGSDNKKMSQKTWDHLKGITVDQLNHKKLYVMDGFCGANKQTRLSVRLVTEIAWMAHFLKICLYVRHKKN